MTESRPREVFKEGLVKISELERGTVVEQYQYRTDKQGFTRRYGPYCSLVLRVSEDTQEWFYLGKEGSSRYNAKLARANDIIGAMFYRYSNAEIATALREAGL